jgi:spore germination protein KC
MFVAEGKAKQFTKIPIIFERFPTEILTAYARQRVTVAVTIKDMLTSIYSGGDLLMPMVIFGVMGAETEKKGESWMGTNGAAIFKQGKMVGTLNTKEMRGALWILGQVNDSEFEVSSPTDGKKVSIVVFNGKTKVKPKIDTDQVTFLITCKAEASVFASSSSIDLTSAKQLKQLERSLEEKLEGTIQQVISKTKSEHADIFNLSTYVKWRYPQKWNVIKSDWREVYASRVEVQPKINITIKSFGVAKKPEWERLLLNPEAVE